MSMNILITANREIRVVKTGKTTLQFIKFNAWQTPTSVTYDILNSSNKIEAYKNFIRAESVNMDIDESLFDEDDILEEREPIGKRIYNPALHHIELFDEWLNMCSEEGYTVEFDMI
jgi:hypothetical protein